GLATIVGIIVGLATSGFVKLLNLSIEFTSGFPYYFVLLPLIETLTAGEKISRSLKMLPVVRALLGGTAVAVPAFVFSDQYLGLGADLGKTETDATLPNWSMKNLFRFRKKEEDPDSL
ncbi:MAG TPA: hypothetical protein VJO14_08470, partial [Bacteroidota bacterium]|nr:hypothetical protein [Bacteroidota bacterium]